MNKFQTHDTATKRARSIAQSYRFIIVLVRRYPTPQNLIHTPTSYTRTHTYAHAYPLVPHTLSSHSYNLAHHHLRSRVLILDPLLLGVNVSSPAKVIHPRVTRVFAGLKRRGASLRYDTSRGVDTVTDIGGGESSLHYIHGTEEDLRVKRVLQLRLFFRRWRRRTYI